jgi:hypothetical protein
MSNSWRTTSRTNQGSSVTATNNGINFTNLSGGVNSESYRITGLSNGTMTYTVASIGTNIVIKLQGSLSNERWFDIQSETITTNGDKTISWSKVVRYIRFIVDSISGGTPSVSNIELSGNSTSTAIGTISLANGGTGSTSASGSRTNLGLGTLAIQSSDSVAITGGTASLTSLTTNNVILNENGTILVTRSPISINGLTGLIPMNNSSRGSVSISTITNASSIGQVITLMNVGAQALVFVDERNATVRDSITCGGNITLAGNTGSTITLIYSARGGKKENGWVCIATHAN